MRPQAKPQSRPRKPDHLLKYAHRASGKAAAVALVPIARNGLAATAAELAKARQATSDDLITRLTAARPAWMLALRSTSVLPVHQTMLHAMQSESVDEDEVVCAITSHVLGREPRPCVCRSAASLKCWGLQNSLKATTMGFAAAT